MKYKIYSYISGLVIVFVWAVSVAALIWGCIEDVPNLNNLFGLFVTNTLIVAIAWMFIAIADDVY